LSKNFHKKARFDLSVDLYRPHRGLRERRGEGEERWEESFIPPTTRTFTKCMMAFPSTFPDCSISRDIFKEPFPGFGERISLACVTGDEN
jgi:hypothetical protein